MLMFVLEILDINVAIKPDAAAKIHATTNSKSDIMFKVINE